MDREHIGGLGERLEEQGLLWLAQSATVRWWLSSRRLRASTWGERATSALIATAQPFRKARISST